MQYQDFLLSRTQLEALWPEWVQEVKGQRLKQVRNHLHCLSFQFDGGYLLLALSPAENLLTFSSQRPNETLEPTPFVMLLRKYLKGRFLQTIQLAETDRVLDLRWAAHCLRLEMMGRHCNGFLLDSEDIILGSYRTTASYRRALSVGQPYQWPLSAALASPRDVLNLQAIPADGSRSEKLLQHWQQIQRHNQLLQQWHECQRPVQRTLKALRRESQKIETQREMAEVTLQERQWAELLQGGYGQHRPGMTSMTVVDYYQPDQPQCELPLEPALDLAANIARYFKRARRAARTLAQTEPRLLTLWSHLEALDAVQQYLQENEATFAQALVQRDFTQADTVLKKLQMQVQKLEQVMPLKRPNQKKIAVSLKGEKRLAYRKFISIDGCEIWVGKSARDNDELSLKLARGNDLWLHAHNWTGSHVIVRLKKSEQISEQSLLDAATLAAWYSQGKEDTRVEVMYTPAKYVHKAKGAPPGQVQVSTFKTLTLKLEPERLQRLQQNVDKVNRA